MNIQEISDSEVLSLSPGKTRPLLLDLYKNGNGDFGRYVDRIARTPGLTAYFSYWEKWFPESVREVLDSRVKTQRKLDQANSRKSLPLALDKRFGEDEIKAIVSNIKSIQLTFGCSFGCPKCGIDAPKGVRENIPFPQLENLFSRYGRDMIGNPFLYWASDPYDYSSGVINKKRYQDVHELATRFTPFRPAITTREVNDKAWLKFLRDEGTRHAGSVYPPRISANDLSDEKIKELEKFFLESGVKLGRHSRTWLDSKKEPHTTYMGLYAKNAPKDLVTGGIGCFDGMLLTPRGLYNLVQLPISSDFPQGHVVVPFEGMGEEDVQVGSSLADVLQHFIVLHRWSRKKDYKSNDLYAIYTGALPQEIHLKNKNSVFRVYHDEKGIVIRSEKVPTELLERAERIQVIKRDRRVKAKELRELPEKRRIYWKKMFLVFGLGIFLVLLGVPFLAILAEIRRLSLPFDYHPIAAYSRTPFGVLASILSLVGGLSVAEAIAEALVKEKFPSRID